MAGLLDRLRGWYYRRLPWYRLPPPIAAPRLVAIRDDLRKHNLFDTEEPPMPRQTVPASLDPKLRFERTYDGTWNDLTCPRMGSAGARFGRNFPLDQTHPDTANLLTPSPREVSRRLLTRTEFQPASILNLMAASWIQFMVHDWFVHKRAPDEHIEIPLEPDDPWPAGPMKVERTQLDPAPRGSKRPPAYVNLNSHWWDGSQVYGCDAETAAKLRTHADGKLKIQADGRLPIDPATGVELVGFTDNLWLGLSMLHSLLVLEHNAICDVLKARHPAWSDDVLYAKARLVNGALMAKIHTVEWTPAILPHPTTRLGLPINWFGFAGESLQERFPGLNDDELLGGIVGSRADHHSAPYALTEEFVSVYRMHALMPDEFTFRSARTGQVLEHRTLPEITGREGRRVLERLSLADLFYSFGVSHPGAVRLHNYPRFLQGLRREDGTLLDLASVDILRDRERGLPRYCQFRRLLRMQAPKTFEELTDDPDWREQLRLVYGGDIEKVDLMVGMYAEPLPPGFGFSETAFRIFVLMASRRLKSDRFYTDDYTPEVYSQAGLDYIRDNGMRDVLLRHLPELKPALEGVVNPFAPWKRVG
jgi:hypothetical protein